MSLTTSPAADDNPGNRTEYRASFITRIHTVLGMGYARLDASIYAHLDEEEITGELTRAMQDAVQDRASPTWTKHFWVHEEVRVHAKDRKGKRRVRVDIEIMQHGLSPRPHFRFEAKRLIDGRSRRTYLGREGLGCLLDGRYAREDRYAGMLGYVQAGSGSDHANRLASILLRMPGKYSVAEEGHWIGAQVVADLSTYRSIHRRPEGLPEIVVLHTFLVFC